ncbi:MAG: type II secretion system F family protein [Thermodesulfovibrionia bacterium]|nr:type II secretion system F family protein [Thermodesulfovibrionia bacterium]
MNIPAELFPIVASAVIFLCFLLLIGGVFLYVRHGTKKLAMIKKIKGESKSEVIPEEGFTRETGGWFQRRVLGFFGELGKRVPASEYVIDYKKLRPMFLKAGIRRENAPVIFFGTKLFFAFILPASILILEAVSPTRLFPTANMMIFIAIAAIVGFYLPNLWMLFKIARRKEAIINGFPDALDLMVVCVEAGMGLDSAITRVAKEIELNNEVLADELNLYNFEMRAGKLRRDALKNLAMRTDVQEVNNLVTLLIQTDKFGTSIGQALKVYSDTMRTQRFQRAEERAAKIPVKLIFPLILFIFPSLFVVILGPAAINIYRVLLKGSF